MLLGRLLKIEINVYNFNFPCKIYVATLIIYFCYCEIIFFLNYIYMYSDIESYVSEFICNSNYLANFEEKSCLHNCLTLNQCIGHMN